MLENPTTHPVPNPAIPDGDLTAHRTTLDALTGIRFFAAFYVVLFHSRVTSLLFEHGHPYAGNFINSGYMAVPLFFLLSGFILAYTYSGQLTRPGAYRRFWEARFARIWPVYVVSLLATSFVTRYVPTPGTVVATLLMVQAWNPFNLDLAGAWNFVCWTLSVEAFFYLTFPAMQTRLSRASARRCLFVLALALLVCVLINSGPKAMAHPAPGIFHFVPLPILHLPEFIAGVALGNCFLRRGPSERPSRIPGLWTFSASLLSVLLLAMPSSRWASLVVASFAALIWGLASERTFVSRLLSTRLLVLGGGISYSIYLMQFPVKMATLHLGSRVYLGPENLRVAGTMALLIVIAYILFRAVENPARTLLRAAFARLEERRTRGA